MPRWIRLLYRTPILDRCAHELMWHGGGFLVLPPGHEWFSGHCHRPTRHLAAQGAFVDMNASMAGRVDPDVWILSGAETILVEARVRCEAPGDAPSRPL